MRRAALALLGLLAGVPSAGRAAAQEPAALNRRFADELFARGEWYRAATEYERVASYEPAAPDILELRFRVALCSHRAGRHAEAERAFAALAAATSSTELQDRCRLYIGAGKYVSGAFADAHAVCAAARAASPASPHADRLAYLDGLSLLHERAWTAARAAFDAVPASSSLRSSGAALADLADHGAAAPLHRPWADGALSAVVPGLGQIVCGYHWDGLSALLLTGASIAVAAEGFRRHSGRLETAGLVLCAVWYPANILGGANAARRANRAAHEVLMVTADRLSTLSLE